MSATEYPLRLYQKVKFLGLDGLFHVAKVVVVTDQNNAMVTIVPGGTQQRIQRASGQAWRGAKFWIEF